MEAERSVSHSNLRVRLAWALPWLLVVSFTDTDLRGRAMPVCFSDERFVHMFWCNVIDHIAG